MATNQTPVEYCRHCGKPIVECHSNSDGSCAYEGYRHTNGHHFCHGIFNHQAAEPADPPQQQTLVDAVILAQEPDGKNTLGYNYPLKAGTQMEERKPQEVPGFIRFAPDSNNGAGLWAVFFGDRALHHFHRGQNVEQYMADVRRNLAEYVKKVDMQRKREQIDAEFAGMATDEKYQTVCKELNGESANREPQANQRWVENMCWRKLDINGLDLLRRQLNARSCGLPDLIHAAELLIALVYDMMAYVPAGSLRTQAETAIRERQETTNYEGDLQTEMEYLQLLDLLQSALIEDGKDAPGLEESVEIAISKIQRLDKSERELQELRHWLELIRLAVCDPKKAVAREVLSFGKSVELIIDKANEADSLRGLVGRMLMATNWVNHSGQLLICRICTAAVSNSLTRENIHHAPTCLISEAEAAIKEPH